jgi:hypothetical protein
VLQRLEYGGADAIVKCDGDMV